MCSTKDTSSRLHNHYEQGTYMSVAPWSYSRIKAFEQCPKQFYHLKVAKDYEEPQTEAMFYGNDFHSSAEHHVRDNVPLPAKFSYAQKAIDALKGKRGNRLCEYEMGLTADLEPCGFRSKNVWFRGIADLIILDSELAWVVDYKTGKSARYADKGQLELMSLAVFKHFPAVKKVRAGLLFVVSNEFIRDTYNEEDAPSLWEKWLSDFARMEKAYESDTWNAHPSGLCKRHCAVLECQHNGRK
tara:strand:+ start:234 stop:959 length:726 start_codon:yes stop_codon:yes gene_type:complete